MPSALPRLIVDMLQNGLRHRDGSDLLDVSLPKLIVPSICCILTADLGGSSMSLAGTCDWVLVILVMTGVLYIAYADDCQPIVTSLSRLKPFPMQRALALVMCFASNCFV